MRCAHYFGGVRCSADAETTLIFEGGESWPVPDGIMEPGGERTNGSLCRKHGEAVWAAYNKKIGPGWRLVDIGEGKENKMRRYPRSHTTLRWLREQGACATSLRRLQKRLFHYNEDTPISFGTLVAHLGLFDAQWAAQGHDGWDDFLDWLREVNFNPTLKEETVKFLEIFGVLDNE